MKKTTAKDKVTKVKGKGALAVPDLELEEVTPEETPVAAELDPDILKVFVKPKKAKNTLDATDYIPELERGDTDEELGSDSGNF